MTNNDVFEYHNNTMLQGYPLTNSYVVPGGFKVDGIAFDTVDRYYCCVMMFSNINRQHMIFRSDDPVQTAKQIMDDQPLVYDPPYWAHWSSIASSVMYKALYAKFNTEYMKSLLLFTLPYKTLVDKTSTLGTTHDNTDQNKHGEMLTQIRDAMTETCEHCVLIRHLTITTDVPILHELAKYYACS